MKYYLFICGDIPQTDENEHTVLKVEADCLEDAKKEALRMSKESTNEDLENIQIELLECVNVYELCLDDPWRKEE